MTFFRASEDFSLGLERTGGFETVAFCEIETYCRAVLAKHWPGVKQYNDVRTLTADTLRSDGITVNVICGGFPCQDISTAGKGAGMAGERSGLWREYARIIGELRPQFVIVENVSALLGRGLADVLGDLATLGYDAEWHCIPASAVGAPHRRDRVWIVANATQKLLNGRGFAESDKSPQSANVGCYVANANPRDEFGRRSAVQMGWGRFASEAIKNGNAAGIEWRVEPEVGRVAYGISSRVDRLGALGNAVVPQVVEIIGRAILEAEGLTP